MRAHTLSVALSFRPKHRIQAILGQVGAAHQRRGWGTGGAVRKEERTVSAKGGAGRKERGKDCSGLGAGQNRDVGFQWLESGFSNSLLVGIVRV